MIPEQEPTPLADFSASELVNYRQQARHRFFYLHETVENLMAQINVTRKELTLLLSRRAGAA